MKIVFVLLSIVLLVRVDADICHQHAAEYKQCTTTAHADYAKSMKQPDGRPDFAARKACNYLTSGVKECGKKLSLDNCNSEEKIEEMTDTQIKGIMSRLETSITSWDSEKCPPVKEYMDRIKAAAAEVEAAKQEAATPETTEATGTGVKIVTSGLLLAGLLLL